MFYTSPVLIVFILRATTIIAEDLPKSSCHKGSPDWNYGTTICTNITDKFDRSINWIDGSLTCVDCHLPILDKDTVGPYDETSLNLSNSHIKTIFPNAFEHFSPTLEQIILNNNEIASIPANIFNKFPLMQDINLRHNYLRNISGVFEDMVVVGLDVSQNEISSIGFRNFSVVRMNISHNRIKLIDVDAFKSVQFWKGFRTYQFQELSLNHNEIEELIAGTFRMANESTLRGALYLDHNKLTIVVNGTFDGLNVLTYLFLNDNEISELQSESFKGLEELEQLNLSHNKLTEITHWVFQYLRNLTHLYLGFNSIEKIDDFGFSGLLKLQRLDLTQNKLKSISSNSLALLGEMRNLELTGNKLHRLDLKTISTDNKKLYSLAIDENFWICTDLVEMYKLVNGKGSRFVTSTRFDVPNFQGIPCSRQKLDSYDTLDFNTFLELIASDGVLDLYVNESPKNVREVIARQKYQLRGISYMLILLSIISGLVLVNICVHYLYPVLKAKKIITSDKYRFLHMTVLDNV